MGQLFAWALIRKALPQGTPARPLLNVRLWAESFCQEAADKSHDPHGAEQQERDSILEQAGSGFGGYGLDTHFSDTMYGINQNTTSDLI